MAEFDFKRYHMRSSNAATGEERAAINQELKDLYASLSEVDKKDFNEQLQKFLAAEQARLKSDLKAVGGLDSAN